MATININMMAMLPKGTLSMRSRKPGHKRAACKRVMHKFRNLFKVDLKELPTPVDMETLVSTSDFEIHPSMVNHSPLGFDVPTYYQAHISEDGTMNTSINCYANNTCFVEDESTLVTETYKSKNASLYKSIRATLDNRLEYLEKRYKKAPTPWLNDFQAVTDDKLTLKNCEERADCGKETEKQVITPCDSGELTLLPSCRNTNSSMEHEEELITDVINSGPSSAPFQVNNCMKVNFVRSTSAPMVFPDSLYQWKLKANIDPMTDYDTVTLEDSGSVIYTPLGPTSGVSDVFKSDAVDTGETWFDEFGLEECSPEDDDDVSYLNLNSSEFTYAEATADAEFMAKTVPENFILHESDSTEARYHMENPEPVGQIPGIVTSQFAPDYRFPPVVGKSRPLVESQYVCMPQVQAENLLLAGYWPFDLEGKHFRNVNSWVPLAHSAPDSLSFTSSSCYSAFSEESKVDPNSWQDAQEFPNQGLILDVLTKIMN